MTYQQYMTSGYESYMNDGRSMSAATTRELDEYLMRNDISPIVSPRKVASDYSEDMTAQGLIRSDTVEQVKEQDEDGFWDTIWDGVTDIPVAVARGAVGFGESIAELADTGVEMFGGDLFDETQDLDWADKLGISETETIFGGFVETGTQFAIGMLPAFGAIRGISSLNKLNKAINTMPGKAGMFSRVGKDTLTAATSDFLSFDAHDERLSNFIQSNPSLANDVTQWLAADDKDGVLEGRLKNTIEGVMLAPFAELAMAGLRKFKDAKNVAGDVDKLKKELSKTIEDRDVVNLSRLVEANPALVDAKSFDETVTKIIDTHKATDGHPLNDPLYGMGLDKSSSQEDIAAAATKKAADQYANAYLDGRATSKERKQVFAGATDDGKAVADLLYDQIDDAAAKDVSIDQITDNVYISDAAPIHKLTNQSTTAYAAKFAESVFDTVVAKQKSLGKTDSEIAQSVLDGVAIDAGLTTGTYRQLNKEVMSNGKPDMAKVKQLYQQQMVLKGLTERLAYLSRTLDSTNVNPEVAKSIGDMLKVEFVEAAQLVASLSTQLRKASSLDNALKAKATSSLVDTKKFATTYQGNRVKAEKRIAAAKQAQQDLADGKIDFIPDDLEKVKYNVDQEIVRYAQKRAGAGADRQARALAEYEQLHKRIEIYGGKKEIDALQQMIRVAAPFGEKVPSPRIVTDHFIKASKDGRGQLFVKAHRSVFYNAMLSNPATIIMNVVGNTIFQQMQLGARAIGGIGTPEARMAVDQFFAQFLVIADATKAAYKTLLTGENILDRRFTKLDVNPNMSGIQDRVAKEAAKEDLFLNLAQSPMRLLQAGDEFQKHMTYRSYMYAEGLREIRSMRKAGQDVPADYLHRKISDSISEIDGSYLRENEAIQAARETTFTNDLPGMLKPLQDLMAHEGVLGDIARIFVPFFKTPTNVALQGLNYTPLTMLSKTKRQMLLGKAGTPRQQALVKGQLVFSLMAASTAVGLVQTGVLTGNGPQNPELFKRKLETGWKPRSIRIGDRWVPYDDIAGLGAAIGFIANIAELTTDTNVAEEDRPNILAASAMAMTSFLDNSTFTGDLAEGLGMLTDQNPAKMERFIANRVSAYVPNAIATANKDMKREMDDFFDYLYNKVPSLSNKLDPKRNALGELQLSEPIGLRMLDASKSSYAKQDKVLEEYLKIGFSGLIPQSKSAATGGMDLKDYKVNAATNQSAYDRLLELRGEIEIDGMTLRERLESVISSRSYQADKDVKSRSDLLKKIVKRYNTRSQTILFRENKELSKLKQIGDAKTNDANRARLENRPAKDVQVIIQELGFDTPEGPGIPEETPELPGQEVPEPEVVEEPKVEKPKPGYTAEVPKPDAPKPEQLGAMKPTKDYTDKEKKGSPQYIMTKLIEDGDLPRTAVIGIVANLMVETGYDLDPNKRQLRNGPGRGLAQWESGGRYDTDPINLKKYARSKGKEWNDLDTQIGFILHEMTAHREYRAVKARLMNAKTIEEATIIFLTEYEKAGTEHRERRLNQAEKLRLLFDVE